MVTSERDHLEIQIENPIPSPLPINQTVHLVYTLKKGTSTRGGDTLIDNHGHSYQMKRDQRRHSLHWRCKYNKPPYSCKHSLKQSIQPVKYIQLKLCGKALNLTHAVQSLG